MALSSQEEQQIANIIIRILDAKLDEFRKEIVAGFVETIDWHNDNFAKIMKSRTDATVNELYKRQRERIEIYSHEEKVAEEEEKQASDRAFEIFMQGK